MYYKYNANVSFEICGTYNLGYTVAATDRSLGVVKQIAMTMTIMKCLYVPSLSR